MFRAAEQDLQRLGFRFSHCEQAASPFRVGDATVWTQVCVNDQEHCTASIVPSDVPDACFPCHIAFSTRYRDGSTLLTVNGQAHRFVPGIPGLLLVDAWAPDVETHWQVHRQAAANRAPEAGQAVLLSPADAVAAHQRFLDGYVDYLLRGRWVSAAGPDLYRFRALPALRFAARMLRGERRLAALRARMARAGKMPAAAPPPEQELAAYRRLEAISRGRGLGWLPKVTLFVASVALFALAVGMVLDLRIALLLVAALLFHELGHLLGMRLFGYRDLQGLFLPFLGAVAFGKKGGAPPHQRVIVYLLGPLPGLLLGWGLLYLSGGACGGVLYQAGLIALILNYFNLLPIMPLDGGQVLNVVLFERFPRVQVWFTGASALFTGLAALWLGKTLFWVLAGVLVLIAWVQWRQVGAVRRLSSSTPVGEQLDEDARLRRVLAALREPPYERLAFGQKFQLARALMERLRNRPASLAVAGAALTVYVCALLIPVYVLMPQLRLGSPSVEAAPAWEERAASAAAPGARWRVYMEAGEWFADREDEDGARRYYGKAVAVAEGFGAKDLRLAEALVRLAGQEDDQAAARALNARALTIQETVLGPRAGALADTLEALAWTYDYRGAGFSEALRLWERALQIRRAVDLKHHPQAVVASLGGLATLYEGHGDLAGAERSLREAVEVSRAAPASSAQTAFALETAADFYLRHGRYGSAEALLQQSLEYYRKVEQPAAWFGESRIQTALGWARLLQGDASGALPWLQAALNLQERHSPLGSRDPALAALLLDMVCVHVERREYRLARAALEGAARVLSAAGETLAQRADTLDASVKLTGRIGGLDSWRLLRSQAQAKAIRRLLTEPQAEVGR
jgi:Zn-dependent protease/tetratricopeptide (TPR) repeat protein